MTISLIISASDILLSMLFNLLIANITTLLCFSFLFLVAFGILCNFFIIPVENENSILRPTLVIPSGVPITVANTYHLLRSILPLVVALGVSIFTKFFTN